MHKKPAIFLLAYFSQCLAELLCLLNAPACDSTQVLQGLDFIEYVPVLYRVHDHWALHFVILVKLILVDCCLEL